jgi:uncharacterized membrane protein
LRKFFGILLRGVFALAPVVLTLYILYILYRFTDGLFKGLLQRVGFYFPGLGVLATLAVIFLAGLLASHWFTKKLIGNLDKFFIGIPLIGNVYGIIKDTINTVSSNKNDFARLVRINLPNGLKVLGFLTNEEQNVFIPEGYVAVYVMQSMQWAGNLILVPRDTIELVEATTEESLKFIASAGLIKGKTK